MAQAAPGLHVLQDSMFSRAPGSPGLQVLQGSRFSRIPGFQGPHYKAPCRALFHQEEEGTLRESEEYHLHIQ